MKRLDDRRIVAAVSEGIRIRIELVRVVGIGAIVRSVGNPIIVPVGLSLPAIAICRDTGKYARSVFLAELPHWQAMPVSPQRTPCNSCLSRLTCDKNKPQTDQKHIDGTSRHVRIPILFRPVMAPQPKSNSKFDFR